MTTLISPVEKRLYYRFQEALEFAQENGHLSHELDFVFIQTDLSIMTEWCKLNISDDAIPPKSHSPANDFQWNSKHAWTFNYERFWFDNEDDRLAFKMKFL